MKITNGQKAILLTCDKTGLTNRKSIKKVLPNYGPSLHSMLRRKWLIDASGDLGKGWFALCENGGTALREVLGREPKYNQDEE